MLCAIFMNVSAQEHLTFKGVPINGHITTFVNKLKGLGFEEITVSDNIAVVKGEFGEQDCQIGVYASKKSKTVHMVAVILNETSSWYSLKSTYTEYKKLLMLKYGNGKSFEYFSDPYYEGDGYELSAVRNEKCTYMTVFDTPNGDISIKIIDAGNPCTVLGYVDEINHDIAEKEKNAMISGDL